jgi:hypothetical protein
VVGVCFEILLELLGILKMMPVLSKLLDVYRTLVYCAEDGESPRLLQLPINSEQNINKIICLIYKVTYFSPPSHLWTKRGSICKFPYLSSES